MTLRGWLAYQAGWMGAFAWRTLTLGRAPTREEFERAQRAKVEPRLPVLHAGLDAYFRAARADPPPARVLAELESPAQAQFLVGGAFGLGGNKYRHGILASASRFYVTRVRSWITETELEVLDAHVTTGCFEPAPVAGEVPVFRKRRVTPLKDLDAPVELSRHEDGGGCVFMHFRAPDGVEHIEVIPVSPDGIAAAEAFVAIGEQRRRALARELDIDRLNALLARRAEGGSSHA